MKSTELLEHFRGEPTFTIKQFNAVNGGSPGYSRLYIHRLKNAGKIHEVRSGIYTTVGDPFIISSRIVWPSYISFWSALRYHNLTEQLPHAIWIITTKYQRKSSTRILNTDLYITVTKPQWFFGYEKIAKDGYEVFIANPEKAIIDSLLFSKISISEIFQIISNNKKALRWSKLIKYALQTGNGALIKRVGYLLDVLGHDYIRISRNHIYGPITPLQPGLHAKGNLNRKWKLLVNVRL